MATNQEPILRLKSVTKQFPGVLALNAVDLEVRAAEVHGLLGENGAGKSTLIKILTGAYQPDSGEIFFAGRRLERLTPKKSLDIGIACIYQELNLISHMSVAENIFLGHEEFSLRRLRWIDRKKMLEKSEKLLTDLALNIDPRTPTGTLGVGHQQIVEICRAISTNARLIIMDEPTSSLTQRETEDLFRIIERLKGRGVTVLFVSHRLEEAKRLCDGVTILRDGCVAATLDMKDTSLDQIIRHMVGRNIENKFPKIKAPIREEALCVRGLRRQGVLHDISFSLYAGEVLGVAGLVGAGRTEMARAIIGADPIDGGSIKVFGREVKIRSPRDAIREGIALLTENRKEQGLILIQSIEFNTTLVQLDKHAVAGILKLSEIKSTAEKLAADLQLRPLDVSRPAGHLSGGNQQKVVIAKWLCSRAKIFIFDEPTKGIDVGAKVEVYNLINALVAEGAAVMIICSELPEVLGMSDRIMVMHEGTITAVMNRGEANQENIMYAAVGAPNSNQKRA
jgi:ribose transport system ATP-binding protein